MEAFILSLALNFASAVNAKCACGHAVNSTQEANYALFTDLLETDFLHLQDVAYNSSYDIGWIPQSYETSPQEAHGPFGMAKQSSNIISNYIENQYNWNGAGINTGDPGVQLWVRSKPISTSPARTSPDDLIPSAELVSERDDILYGSFRIAMKTTNVNGTCSAFFFYRNDSQEIDLEILSSQQRGPSTWPIHMAVQNTTTSSTGNISYRGSVQDIYNLTSSLPGGTTGNYNEYRFDWLPGRLSYYINGQLAWTTTKNVPTSPGQIHISHWSNGNPLWTGGPPEQDAVLTVSYVKAYFNSTNSTRNEDYRKTCQVGRPGEMCEIPTQMVPPNPFGSNGNETGRTFFFTRHANMTPGQTDYDGPIESLSMRQIRHATQWLMVAVLAVWVCFFCPGQ